MEETIVFQYFYISLHAYLKYVCDEQRQNYILSDYVTYTRT